ncbi:two-component system response regulator [Kitasatospora sp. NPDC059577]|uniref:response regulator n=1 Tax=Kitasatospora sp. NPDC059577 TaxID=3346873 RepID=UPI003676F484
MADDQHDVARTLCAPLRKAGAWLRYVSDGQTALDELTAQPFDLALVDMKMPPEDWGGVWLLSQFETGGQRVPALVLSGEGAGPQLKQALRLGAADWIYKEDAGEELLDRCVTILEERLAQALSAASNRLPTPIAFRIARYIRTTDLDKQLAEGLHTLESILRLAATVGLATTPPAPLRGITPERLAAPSMGTWFDMCTALADAPGAGAGFKRLFSWLAPDSVARRSVREFITIRNDLAHGRATARRADRDRLDALLRRFAHRATSYGSFDLAVPASMTFDGSKYAVEVLVFRGTGKPIPDKVFTQGPVVGGTVLLLDTDAEPVTLAPLLTSIIAEASGTIHCLQFDGLQRGRGGLGPVTPLRYSRASEGDEAMAEYPIATWPALAQWTAL